MTASPAGTSDAKASVSVLPAPFASNADAETVGGGGSVPAAAVAVVVAETSGVSFATAGG